jgi:hypothetical protein
LLSARSSLFRIPTWPTPELMQQDLTSWIVELGDLKEIQAHSPKYRRTPRQLS